MSFTTLFASQEAMERDTIIAAMRGFTQQCLERTARTAGLTESQVQAIVRRGNLTGPGTYRQANYSQIGGLTPFYKQFKPTSVLFERAMLGTETAGGNDWLVSVRINFEPAGGNQYRITALYAGLLRWANNGTDIQEAMLRSAAAAVGHDLPELTWAELRDHMWGQVWRPDQVAGTSDDDLIEEISQLLAALIPALKERRQGKAAPDIMLHPRFAQFSGSKVADGSYFTPPTEGGFQFEFRAHERRLLAGFGRQLSAIAAPGGAVTLKVTGDAQWITSCSGRYTTVRELGAALGLRHGDHARMTLQPDGTWRVDPGEPPAMLIQVPGAPEAVADHLATVPAAWLGVPTKVRRRWSRVQEYRSAMERERPVTVYLADASGTVTAKVRLTALEFRKEDPIPAPMPLIEPPVFPDNRPCRLWVRLTDLEPVALTLADFVQEETGLPLDRLTDPLTYVYQEKPSGEARPALELIGCSGEIDAYVADMQRLIAEQGAAMYFWTFGIRNTYRDRLQQGSFWLNIYRSGGGQEITHRCRVLAIHTTDDPTGIPSPNLAQTPAEDQERLERTWLQVTDLEELLEPIPLQAFVDYDSGDAVLPQALINAFAYVRRRPSTDDPIDPVDEEDEVRLLGEILDAFAESPDLVYDPADLINLHHALNALPHKHFVILHGVSGTGKSQFAQGYTNALYGRGLTDAGNRYYQIVAVQPTWQDRTPLLGYYNPLTETYEQPPFLQHLLKAAADPAHVYVICLDEMNLAVVEHYLADFLSAWESGEAIALHHHAGKVTNVPEELRIPSNLAVIGTVNVDETTHGFSPKVLDRAFTVELTRVDLAAYGERFAGRYGETDDERALVARATDLLRRVHAILEPRGLHFAYRTASEILHFLLTNHRGSHSLEEAAALDLMLSQKVLPKLRGDDRLLPMLDELLALFAPGDRCHAVVARMKADAERFGTFQYWR